ncbi:hypothetical protein GJ496_008714 [Pomphorhynchus laevis]|nr:hypothetical protein GJ496_008714 [Pomphorhynchus laevis]
MQAHLETRRRKTSAVAIGRMLQFFFGSAMRRSSSKTPDSAAMQSYRCSGCSSKHPADDSGVKDLTALLIVCESMETSVTKED